MMKKLMLIALFAAVISLVLCSCGASDRHSAVSGTSEEVAGSVVSDEIADSEEEIPEENDSIELLNVEALYSGDDENVLEFAEDVVAGDYSLAIACYNSSIIGNSYKEIDAKNFLNSYLETAWTAWLDGTITDAELDGILTTLVRVDNSLMIITTELCERQNDYNVISTSREEYARGDELQQNGSYLDAIDCYFHVSFKDSENYYPAIDALNICTSLYCANLSESVDTYEENGEYTSAIDLINSGLDSLYSVWTNNEYSDMQCFTPDQLDFTPAEGLESRCDTLTVLRIESEIISAIDSGDYATAIRSYEDNCSSGYTFTAELTTKIATAKTEYRKQIIADSIDCYNSGDIYCAYSCVNNALDVLPEDEELLKYVELYDSAIPKTLSEVKQLSGRNINESSAEDYFGNEYETTWRFSKIGLDSTQSYSFYTNNSFTTVGGTLFVDPQHSGNIQVKFIAEDKVLYSTGKLTREDGAQSFSVDLTGVDELEIEVTWKDYFGAGAEPYLYMTDVLFEKDISGSSLLKTTE